METEFSKVSLGFAEFVAQLIQETFDAVLESQNYQYGKYLELEEALNTTSDTVFIQKYITQSEIDEQLLGEYGFLPDSKTVLSTDSIKLLKELFRERQDFEKILVKNILTEHGVSKLKEPILQKLLTFKRTQLKMLVSRPELARLHVDSGEIKAKLELFCLNETETPAAVTQPPISTKTAAKLPNAKDAILDAKVQPTISKTDFVIKNLSLSKALPIKATEIIDKETSLKTILIDKSSLTNKLSSLNIPTSRLVANPVNASKSTSNLYSEVTIKFKSV